MSEMPKKQKGRQKWTYINITVKMAEDIEEAVKAAGGTYHNRAHFIREAIRLKLEELKKAKQSER